MKGWFTGMRGARTWFGFSVVFLSILACNIGVLPPQENLDRELVLTIAIQTATARGLQEPSLAASELSLTPQSKASETASSSGPSGTSSSPVPPGDLPAPAFPIPNPPDINLPSAQSDEQPLGAFVYGKVTTFSDDPAANNNNGDNNNQGVPVRMAEVQIEHLTQPGVYETTTNKDGNYEFSGIPVGEVRIMVDHSKYSPRDRIVNIKSTGENKFDFILTIFIPGPDIPTLTPTPCPFIICLPFTIPTAVPNSPNFDNPYFEP